MELPVQQFRTKGEQAYLDMFEAARDGLPGARDSFVAGLRESLYAQASALATRELVIAPVTHGEQSGIVGCAAMAKAFAIRR